MDTHMGSAPAKGHYGRMGAMVLLSFAAMYALMYAMVDSAGNIHPNRNQLYMAGLMAAPMALIELFLMRMMFPNRRRNAVIAAGAVAATVLFFVLIREQTAVGDKQFVKSMIPHHSGAILMCREASLRDAELRSLCRQIVASQAEEIRQMETILRRL